MAHEDALALMESRIRTIPDYPKQGIMFRDITPMLQDAEAFGKCIEELRKSLGRLEAETRRYKDRVINMLIGYGGRDDIVHAVRNAVRNVKNAAAVSESTIEKYLLSNAVPEIDLVIRTSGEKRLSGFMPWQTEYSELYFSKKLWPEFTKRDLQGALADYSRRQRRFGK